MFSTGDRATFHHAMRKKSFAVRRCFEAKIPQRRRRRHAKITRFTTVEARDFLRQR